MTKREFFLKTVIAMAGNPKYVDDGDLEGGKIIDQATALANTIEEMGTEEVDGNTGSIFEDRNEDSMTLIANELCEIKEILEDRK